MARVHPEAVIKPGKTELVSTWLLSRPDYTGPAGQRFKRFASYRFDDPAGEVGIESMVVRGESDGVLYQVAMTYRAAPLTGGELMSMMEHSVLGQRYIYVAESDPVAVEQFTRAILDGGVGAEQIIVGGDHDGVSVPSGMTVRGSGGEPLTGATILVVAPTLPANAPDEAVGALEALWDGGTGPVAWLVAG